jgi:hypothetical protein
MRMLSGKFVPPGACVAEGPDVLGGVLMMVS